MAITLERKGINYGHHLTASLPYKQRVRHDLRLLWDAGYRNIRPAMPPFDAPAASLAMQQFITTAALSIGFQVLYGVVSYQYPTVSATRQAAHLAYVQMTTVPYLVTLNNPNVALVIDNETEEHVDGTTLTAAQAQANIASAAASIRATQPSMTLTSAHAAARAPGWSGSLTSFDFLGFNLYYGFNANDVNGFTQGLLTARAAIGSKLFVSEWGTSNGYADALNLSTSTPEQDYADVMAARLEQLERYALPHAVFSFGDGQFGVPKDTFSLRTSSGKFRRAWYRLNGTKEPN